MKALLASVFSHWQSTLFGFLQGLSGELFVATQHANLSPAQFWAVLVASIAAQVKGALSADANKIPPVAQ